MYSYFIVQVLFCYIIKFVYYGGFMNKKINQEDKNKKRRKLGFWWWSLGAIITLTTLVTCSLTLPLVGSGSASSSVASSSTSIVSSSSSAQVVNRVELIAIEVERLPIKLNYQATDVISTQGGSLRLVYSDYSSKVISMNDAMIDTTRINLSRVGSTSITLRYEENGVVKFIGYTINVIPFVVNPVKVSLDISSADLLLGQSINLNYIIEPLNATFNNVVWSSSNTNVATVDQSGVVSTRGLGAVIITVSVDSNLTATSTLNVITLPITNPPAVYEEPEIEPRGEDWIPIASGHDLMMIGVSGATYTFAADYPDAAVTFSNTTLTPGLTGKYYLLTNLDLSTFNNTNYAWSGLVAPNSILPIGFIYNPDTDQLVNVDNVNQLTPFTGEFDGNNKKISGMKISLSGNYNYVGLFSSINNGYVYDLEIELSIIDQQTHNYSFVGLLAGFVYESLIENVMIDRGSVVGKDLIGGMVGYAEYSTIENANSSAQVTGVNYVGGLIGEADWSEITDSFSSGLVTGVDAVGGLIGYLYDSEIYFSYATGSISGRDYVGGLVGESYGVSGGDILVNLLEDSYSTGNVNGRNYIGGLIGFSRITKLIGTSYSGTVTSSSDYVGGLIGYSITTEIINSIAIATITAVDDFVGGLVGYATTTIISNSSFTGTVRGDDDIGGLVGYALSTTLTNLVVDANVSGDDDIGGAVGELKESTINNIVVGSLSSLKIIVGDEDVGGLVGRSDNSSINNSISHLDIIGDDEVGGLVGSAFKTSIFNSQSHGNISGEYSFNIQDDNDTDSDGVYNITSIFISGINNIGGVVGELEEDSTIVDSISTGKIIGLNFNQELINLMLVEITSRYGPNAVLPNPIPIMINSVYNLGGLVGDIDASSNVSQIKIINSHSTSEVVGINFTSVVNNLVTYNSIAHRLAISTSQGGTAVYSIGGFIGELAQTNLFPILISGSSSSGDVYGVKFEEDANLNLNNEFAVTNIEDIGGFIGLIADDLILDSSISSGDVYGLYAGISSGKLSIEYMRNIGGFIGRSFKYIGEEFRITNVSNSGDVYGIRLGNTSNINNIIYGIENIGGLIGFSIIENNTPLGLNYYNFLNNSTNLGNVYGIYLNNYSGLVAASSYSRGSGVGGLIGRTNSMQIANVTNGVQGIIKTKVVGLRINSYDSSNGILYGFNRVGGLIGSSEYIKIDNSINHSDVIAAEIITNNTMNKQYFESNRVGGLIGYSRGDYITNSFSSSNVHGLANSSSTLVVAIDEAYLNNYHSKYIGGLIGETSFSSIIDSYASGEVSGHYAVGGLVGSAYGITLKDSYSTSKVTGTSSVGGLVGYSDFGEYNKVYYLNQESGAGIYNIKGLNDVGGLIGQAMHPFVENAYAKFNKIIGTYNVGGLSGRIWNDYHDGSTQITYSSVNSFEYVYAIGSIELDTVPIIPVSIQLAAVGGLVGEVESVFKNAFADVDISPTSSDKLAIGAVFGIVADPLAAQSVSHIVPTTDFGKIYYESNISNKIGANQLGSSIDSDIANITSQSISNVINFTFLTTAGNWSNAAWDVATAPNNNFMWNLDGSSLVLSDLPFFTITASLGGASISTQNLNPIVVRESNSNDSTFPNLVITLTLKSNYYSYYVPSDPVAFNAPTTSIGFSRAIPAGINITHSINSNVMTITLSSTGGLNSNLIDQFSGFIYVFTTRAIPGNPNGDPSRESYGSINLPTIMFEFLDAAVS
jgi:hypothetical protein